MASVTHLANGLLVQLFKHVPWLASRWARRHHFVEAPGIPWTPVAKPLSAMAFALVTTAGIHLKTQEPFDMTDPDGDPSFRVIPFDARREDLTITHKYYDHSAADRDINVVLPLDRMRGLLAEGRIGGVAASVYSFMGHIDGPHLKSLMEETAPEVVRLLKRDAADAAVLTPA